MIGFLLPIKDHMMKGKKTYKVYNDYTKWVKQYQECINRDVIENIPKGLSACIYTQLSDVEEELNGFITFDREVTKVNIDDIREINDKISL